MPHSSDDDLDWEDCMLGHRGNPSQELDVPPAPVPSNNPPSMAPTQLNTLQPTASLSDQDDARANVTHRPPSVMAPSHHPPPISQMYTPSTLNDHQGNHHTVPLNLPIPYNSSLSMRTPQSTLSTFPPLPVQSGLVDDPGAQVPMFTPIPTFVDSHQGNYLPPSISSDLRPGASAPMWAPPPPPPPTWSNSNSYQGNWPPSFPFNLHPGAMMQMHAPPPTPGHNNFNSSLPLPHVIVPSQNHRPGGLAIPAHADYRRNFPPPIVSMDGVSTLPPAAPADVPPLAMLTPPPRSDTDETSLKRKVEWQFIECSGQRQKGFKAPRVLSALIYKRT